MALWIPLFPKLLALQVSSALFFNQAAASVPSGGYGNICRYLPGDEGWPNPLEWQQLNATVSGRLIATLPPGHACHDPYYDAKACATLKESWGKPETYFLDPAGIMSAWHQNGSCDPFTPRSTPCLQGKYVDYAINVSGAADVVAGIKFAHEKNVRLVIKNTGHDYIGKSTGVGALSLWTHNLNSIEFSNYTSNAYTGPAIKMGAGVQAFDAYVAADKARLKVVGGSCPTVGLAGGFTQGGGHGMLSTKHGLGSDQALEWEVVTANGTIVTATPTQNSDLYWAITGGGPGTFGVVLSLTAKAYPDGIVSGVKMDFTFESNDDIALWDAILFFQQTALPPIVDAGAHVQWVKYRSLFQLFDSTVPGATPDEMRELYVPFTKYLDSHNITYTMNVTSFPTYFEHIESYLGPLPYGTAPTNQIQDGFFVSRDTASSENNTALIATLQDIATTTNFYVATFNFNVSQAPFAPNSVNPVWRDALTYYIVIQVWNYTLPYDEMAEQERILGEEVMPRLRPFASGSYLNEADYQSPNWKGDFYGEPYERLTQIKQKWDPKSLFYAETAIGSQAWTVAANGRMCRA